MIRLFFLLRLWRPGRLLWVMALVVAYSQGAFAQSPSMPTIDISGLFAQDREARRISATLVPGVRSNKDLTDAGLQDARKRMFNGGAVAMGELYALARRYDGNAALRLIKRLEDQGAAPKDLLPYYTVAAATGRIAGLNGMIAILDTLDQQSIGFDEAQRMRDILVAYAEAGNTTASAAILRYDSRAEPFGPLADDIDRLAQSGNAHIALTQAMAHIQTGWKNADTLQDAQSFLKLATKSTSLRAQVFSQTMLSVVDDRISSLSETDGIP